MEREQRKAAVAAYRERKAVAGIYAVVCRLSEQRWIGRALDLSTVQNRLWFTLRQGGYPHPDHVMCHKISVAAFDAAVRLRSQRDDRAELRLPRRRPCRRALPPVPIQSRVAADWRMGARWGHR